MNKEDLIKYAAMAVGAYLLWQWLTKPGGLLASATPELPALNPGTDAGTGNGAGAGVTGGGETASPGTIVSQTPTSATPTPTDAQIYAAAISSANAGQTGGYRMTAYEWNFFRMVAGRQLGWTEEEIAAKTQADLSSVLDMGQKYTAAEYHAALAKTGLEGLGTVQGWGSGPRYSYQ